MFSSYFTITKALLKIYSPKRVFVYPYNDLAFVVKAANNQNIAVTEIQHAFFTASHSSYFSNYEISPQFLPNEILLFSEEQKRLLSASPLFKEVTKTVVGSYLLASAVGKQPDKVDSFVTEGCKVLVTFQETVESELYELTVRLSVLLPEVLFICKFRPDGDREYFKEKHNLIVDNSQTFYELCLEVTVVLTIYSTTAIEARLLDKEVLVYNYKNLGSDFFGRMYEDDSQFQICNSCEEVGQALEMLSNAIKTPLSTVENRISSQTESEYFANLDKYVKKIKERGK